MQMESIDWLAVLLAHDKTWGKLNQVYKFTLTDANVTFPTVAAKYFVNTSTAQTRFSKFGVNWSTFAYFVKKAPSPKNKM